jgi:hypothetical protein
LSLVAFSGGDGFATCDPKIRKRARKEMAELRLMG